MDNYLSIFKGILSSRGSYLDIYLDGLEDHRKLYTQSNEAGELVQHVTSLLTKSDTRYLGICLLSSFIEDCPIDIFEKKGSLWTTLILKSCNVRDLHLEVNLIYDVLEKIVHKSQQSPDVAKTFASTYLCKIYESLVAVSFSNAKFALKCIETCLRVYPSPSGPYRGIVEKFLWKYVNSTNEEVVQECGKCLHLLQQVRGGGVSGINHKTQWKNYQIQLIGAIHAVYKEMFANCTELYDEKVETKKVPWDTEEQVSCDVEPVKKAAQLYSRCHNLIKYLEIALREPFPVEKPLLVKKILNTINRGLSVNSIMLEQNPIADNIALSVLLPKLHADLLELLITLMSILRGQLRPYSEIVLGIVVDTIKWTSAKNINGNQKTLRKLRTKVYDTLSKWCKIFQSGNRVDTIAEYLIQQILFDITPARNEFTLKVLSGARKHMSKKARRQLYNIQNEKSSITQTHSNDSNNRQIVSEEKDQELCISGLRCLQSILFSSSNFVKPTIIKLVQIHVTRICAMLCEHPPKYSTHLYGNKNCRIEIYNTLYAIIMTPHMLCPPPTEIGFAMLRTALMRDTSVKVGIHCNSILQNLEKLIHPQKESLLFTIDARDVRNTFIKYGQESLVNETAINFANGLLNTEVEDNAHEHDPESNETNSKNDKQHDVNINAMNAEDSYSSPIHINSSDIELDNIEEQHSECINLIKTCVQDTNVIESTSEVDGIEKLIEIDETSISVSPELVLKKNNEGDTTMIGTVIDHKEMIDEPITKKRKIDEEIELNANAIHFDDHGKKLDEDEDTIVADIVSQFVDELD